MKRVSTQLLQSKDIKNGCDLFHQMTEIIFCKRDFPPFCICVYPLLNFIPLKIMRLSKTIVFLLYFYFSHGAAEDATTTTPPAPTSAAPSSEEWNGMSFPNPQSDEDSTKCNVEEKTTLCDPDGILSEVARQNIINQLGKLQNITSHTGTGGACEQQGIIGGVAIANHFVGGNSEVSFFSNASPYLIVSVF